MTVLNRRHVMQNPAENGQSGLSIIITSQKYNGLPLYLRTNMSHIVCFATKNQKELSAIKDELLGDLNPKQQEEFEESLKQQQKPPTQKRGGKIMVGYKAGGKV